MINDFHNQHNNNTKNKTKSKTNSQKKSKNEFKKNEFKNEFKNKPGGTWRNLAEPDGTRFFPAGPKREPSPKSGGTLGEPWRNIPEIYFRPAGQ